MAEQAVSAGFRCEPAVYEELKKIAETEQRSIGNVLNVMVAEQVQRYLKGGWKAIYIHAPKLEGITYE